MPCGPVYLCLITRCRYVRHYVGQSRQCSCVLRPFARSRTSLISVTCRLSHFCRTRGISPGSRLVTTRSRRAERDAPGVFSSRSGGRGERAVGYFIITFWALGRAGSPPLYALRPPRTTPNPRPSERCPRRRKLKHLRSISKFKSHSPKSEASRSGQRARGQQAPAHDVTTPGAPCAPRRNTLVSAHCLNSASLSLSLSALEPACF